MDKTRKRPGQTHQEVYYPITGLYDLAWKTMPFFFKKYWSYVDERNVIWSVCWLWREIEDFIEYRLIFCVPFVLQSTSTGGGWLSLTYRQCYHVTKTINELKLMCCLKTMYHLCLFSSKLATSYPINTQGIVCHRTSEFMQEHDRIFFVNDRK